MGFCYAHFQLHVSFFFPPLWLCMIQLKIILIYPILASGAVYFIHCLK